MKLGVNAIQRNKMKHASVEIHSETKSVSDLQTDFEDQNEEEERSSKDVQGLL